MHLSILDPSPMAKGESPAAALRNTLRLARYADECGFRRFWVPEHHFSRVYAISAPEIVVAALGAVTSRIRIGTGAILLRYYSPLKLAEQALSLHALYPGRIDLGIARGTRDYSKLDRLLGNGESPVTDESIVDKIEQLLAYLDVPSTAGTCLGSSTNVLNEMQTWIVGTGWQGAAYAAALGLPLCYARPLPAAAAAQVLSNYREQFTTTGVSSHPYVALFLQVICAPTQMAARRLAAPFELFIASMVAEEAEGRGRCQPGRGGFDSTEVAVQHLEHWNAARANVATAPNELLVGAPDEIRDKLEELSEQHHVDEFLIQTICHSPEDRVRSYELLATAIS